MVWGCRREWVNEGWFGDGLMVKAMVASGGLGGLGMQA